MTPTSARLARSQALWNRHRLDLRSDEALAQILDRGDLDDWREIYRLAAEDAALRRRIVRLCTTCRSGCLISFSPPCARWASPSIPIPSSCRKTPKVERSAP